MLRHLGVFFATLMSNALLTKPRKGLRDGERDLPAPSRHNVMTGLDPAARTETLSTCAYRQCQTWLLTIRIPGIHTILEDLVKQGCPCYNLSPSWSQVAKIGTTQESKPTLILKCIFVLQRHERVTSRTVIGALCEATDLRPLCVRMMPTRLPKYIKDVTADVAKISTVAKIIYERECQQRLGRLSLPEHVSGIVCAMLERTDEAGRDMSSAVGWSSTDQAEGSRPTELRPAGGPLNTPRLYLLPELQYCIVTCNSLRESAPHSGTEHHRTTEYSTV